MLIMRIKYGRIGISDATKSLGKSFFKILNSMNAINRLILGICATFYVLADRLRQKTRCKENQKILVCQLV